MTELNNFMERIAVLSKVSTAKWIHFSIVGIGVDVHMMFERCHVLPSTYQSFIYHNVLRA